MARGLMGLSTLVVTTPAGFSQGLTRGSIANLDIPNSPLDLGHRIGAPISGDYIHLVSRQRLGDSCRAARVVVGLKVPMALAIPERVEA